MNEIMVLYKGRMVPESSFRTFIYGINGEKMLVESYDEYQKHISSGLYSSTKEKITEKKSKRYEKRGE